MTDTSSRLWCPLSAALVAVAAVAWSAPAGAAPEAGKKVRVVKVSGPVVEAPDPWDLFDLDERIVFSELLASLQTETADAQVGTIVLKVGNAGLGVARSRELAQAIGRARGAGKRVLAHLTQATATSLLVATAANEVVMTPEGGVLAPGIQAEVTHFKGLLDLVGVEADIEAVGKYKSAPEPLTRNDMSPEAREAVEALVDDLYGALVDDLARQRSLSRKSVEALLDRALLTAGEAKRLGLVDRLAYWTEVLAAEEESAGSKPTLAFPAAPDLPDLSSLFGLLALLTDAPDHDTAGESRVALLVAEGPIMLGPRPEDLLGGSGPMVASDEMVRAIREVAKDETIDAVVVRIDSPGGSALASDVIWRELRKLDESIPVVASLGNVAASGGYYIASGARRVVAEPSTVTGSIGVFGGKLVMSGLHDKLGLQTTVISRGKNAGLFSSLGRFTDSEREVLRRVMRHTYDTFVNRVARGRKMSYDAVDRVAQGRVWSGKAAMARGLVDSIGGLHEAKTVAARLAGVAPEKARLVPYPAPRSFMEMLEERTTSLQAPTLNLGAVLATAELAARAVGLTSLLTVLLERERVLAMSPWEMTIR